MLPHKLFGTGGSIALKHLYTRVKYGAAFQQHTHHHARAARTSVRCNRLFSVLDLDATPLSLLPKHDVGVQKDCLED
jgi:hypothetical protein